MENRLNDKMETLPHQVLEYAESLRCLMADIVPAFDNSDEFFDGNDENQLQNTFRQDKMVWRALYSFWSITFG